MFVLGLLLSAAIIAAAAAAIVIRRRFLHVTVDGESMAPTFRRGDRVLVKRIGAGEVAVGAVVVVEKPDSDFRWRSPGLTGKADGRRWMIKRAVAVAGDSIPAGVLPHRCEAGGVVEPGSLVLLGDNRDDSYDSRTIGFFPADRVLGVAVRVVGRTLPHRSAGPADERTNVIDSTNGARPLVEPGEQLRSAPPSPG